MHIHTYETKKLPVGWHNHCYNWIHTEKCCITHIHTYKTKKLPNMVSLIEKWTLPLNSHWKTGPEHISYVPYWIKINMFPTWCNYYAKSMWSPRSPHGQVGHCKLLQRTMNMTLDIFNFWINITIYCYLNLAYLCLIYA